MGILECQNLSRWHGEVMAVNDVNLDVKPGITGLLGPNGAGKTTLFRMAMGLAKPSAGAILVLDEDPWDNAPLLRRIGYVPDGDAPWPDRTGRQATQFMARMSGLDPTQAANATDSALERVGLTAHADKRVAAYSRGMRQRLKFGFALLTRPDVLFLDEPLLATDPLTRRDLVHLVRDLARSGVSVIVSTHVLTDVEALTERIALLDHGRLLAHGTVGEIRDLLERHPRTVRVGTNRPREVGAALWKLESVLSVETSEGGVVARTRDPQTFFQEAQDLLISSELPFTSLTPLDENVEAIFRYLVSDR